MAKLQRKPMLLKQKTPRDKKYLAFIRNCDCTDCQWPASLGNIEAHHIFTGGGSLKCSDYDTVPLCNNNARGCHGKADKRRQTGEGYQDKVRKLQTIWIEQGNNIEA